MCVCVFCTQILNETFTSAYIHRQRHTDTYIRVYYITQITYNTETAGSGQLSRYSDSLRPGLSGNRILVGAKFSRHISTGPKVHLIYCIRSLPGGKAAGA
jgi:hypothetical protein